MPDAELAAISEDTAADATDIMYLADAAGTVDKRMTVGNLAGSPPFTVRTITERTANYTLALSDVNGVIGMNSATGKTVTLPSNATAAIPVGTSGFIYQSGAGTVSVVAGAGATVTGSSLFTFGVGHFMRWLKTSTNGFLVEAANGYTFESAVLHVLAADPHTQYVQDADLSELVAVDPTELDIDTAANVTTIGLLTARSSVLLATDGRAAFSNTTTETSLQDSVITVPAGTLSDEDSVRVEWGATLLNNSGAAMVFTGRVKVNGTAFVSPAPSLADSSFGPGLAADLRLIRINATTLAAQLKYHVTNALGTTLAYFTTSSAPITVADMDTTDLTIVHTQQMAAAHASASVTPRLVYATLLKR